MLGTLALGLLGACGGPSETGGNPDELAVNTPATGTSEVGSSARRTPPQDGVTSGSSSPAVAPSNASGTTAPRPSASPDASPQDAHPPVSATASGGAAPGAGRCHTSMVEASLSPGHPGAGQRYAELMLVNTSGQACKVYGYPGLQLVGTGGNDLPTEVDRTTSREPRAILLTPGESSAALLHWGAVPTGDEPTTGPCQPAPERLRVIPPDETAALALDWPFGPVCGDGHIFVTAFH